MDELEFYNGQMTGDEIDKRIVLISCGTISSQSTTVSNVKITAKHVVLCAIFGTPGNQVGDWSVETFDGSLTVTGTIGGSTTLTLILGIPY